MEQRSRLDEIEDVDFAEKQLLRKGKTREEVKEMLLARGAELKNIEIIIDNIDSEYIGVLRFVASKTIRFLNFMIDLSFLLSVVIGAIHLTKDNTDDYAVLIILVFPLSYYIVGESFFGQTIGKYLTKTIVINKDGNQPSALAILVRTLCRLSPHHIVSIFFHERTFHDRMSRTFVIDKEKWEKSLEDEIFNTKK